MLKVVDMKRVGEGEPSQKKPVESAAEGSPEQMQTDQLLAEAKQLLLDSTEVIREFPWFGNPNATEAKFYIDFASGEVPVEDFDDLIFKLNRILTFMQVARLKVGGEKKWDPFVKKFRELIQKHESRFALKQRIDSTLGPEV